jgi:hypothetical protein
LASVHRDIIDWLRGAAIREFVINELIAQLNL